MSLYYLANAIYTKADIIIQIIKTFVRFLMAYTTPWNTHVHIWRRHRTHTHAGRHEVAVNLFSAFSHPGPSFFKDPPGAVGSFSAPGDQLNRPSRSGTDRRVLFFLHVFLLGFLVEETLCEHGENMQTPHRKAREIAHLSTEGLGRTCPPEPT